MAYASISDFKSIIKKSEEIGLSKTVEFLSENCPTKADKKSIHIQLDRILKKHKRLLKDKKRVKGEKNLEEFLNKEYQFPVPKTSGTSPTTSRHEPFDVNKDDPELIASTYKDVAERLSLELNEAKVNETENKQLKMELVELDKSFETINEKVLTQKRDLKRTASRESYWREKYQELENETCSNESENETQLRNENVQYQIEIQQLKDTIDEIRSELDLYRMVEHEGVQLFDENKKEYITELHTCVYNLLNFHVSTEHVSDVINCVLNLVNKKPNKLPSKSTIKNWSLERSLLARKQVAEKCDDQNTTLYTDETSKYGQKWGSFASSDKEGNYLLLGLRDMATKSSFDTMDTFKEILEDIDIASENENAGKKLLVNIKNTMSDKASTEKKFNILLKEYRDELLPQIVDNFNTLNEESKLAISHMNNFFCGLHSLVHMADTSQKTLYEVEKMFFDDNIPTPNRSFAKNGQSGTLRLIFTASKAFARRGDQKNGCHGNFSTFIKEYLKENGFMSLPLQPLRGNRFNILFVNAGHIYFFKDKMLEFLDNSPNLNGLLQSVQTDLKENFFIAGLKALGLISKLITTPLWQVIENKELSISEMASRYLILKTFLDDSVNDLESVISGNAKLFDDVDVKRDKVFEKLVEPNDQVDGNVLVILNVLLPALSRLVQHEFGDHLPGGIHEVIDNDTTKSAEKHNKYPERVFSYVDFLLGQKPNISSLALESQITFSLNKTNKWLESKTPEEVKCMVEESRKEVKKERDRFKQRAINIREKRLENQRKLFEQKAQQERKRIEKLEKETADMQYYGLWQSIEQIDSELGLIKSIKEKEEALKAQLRFRRHVFDQKADPEVYVFSKVVDGKRQNLSVTELKANVAKLITGAFEIQNNVNGGSILVGKRVKQKFLNEAGAEFWSYGKVISQVPGFPRWFNIIYDNDPAVYSDNLADHYKAGDLIIVEATAASHSE